jgi:LuxR family transcriptional regulator, maltose regulon positive regulatory protein
MAHTTPRVWLLAWGGERRAEVQSSDPLEPLIRLDTAAWDSWLSAPTTRRFAYPIYDERVGYIRGWMTVRKERRSRGSEYWVAYRRLGKRLCKIYLGRSDQVTQSQLGIAAGRFLAMADAQGPAVGDEPGTVAGRR